MHTEIGWLWKIHPWRNLLLVQYYEFIMYQCTQHSSRGHSMLLRDRIQRMEMFDLTTYDTLAEEDPSFSPIHSFTPFALEGFGVQLLPFPVQGWYCIPAAKFDVSWLMNKIKNEPQSIPFLFHQDSFFHRVHYLLDRDLPSGVSTLWKQWKRDMRQEEKAFPCQFCHAFASRLPRMMANVFPTVRKGNAMMPSPPTWSQRHGVFLMVAMLWHAEEDHVSSRTTADPTANTRHPNDRKDSVPSEIGLDKMEEMILFFLRRVFDALSPFLSQIQEETSLDDCLVILVRHTLRRMPFSLSKARPDIETELMHRFSFCKYQCILYDDWFHHCELLYPIVYAFHGRMKKAWKCVIDPKESYRHSNDGYIKSLRDAFIMKMEPLFFPRYRAGQSEDREKGAASYSPVVEEDLCLLSYVHHHPCCSSSLKSIPESCCGNNAKRSGRPHG